METDLYHLRCYAQLLRAAKRQRRATMPGSVQHGRVSDLQAHCGRLCLKLGLPEHAANGTRRHLEADIASLQGAANV